MNNKIEELFNTIENTKEYIEYNEIKELLINDEEIMNLIKEIKNYKKSNPWRSIPSNHLSWNR